MLPVNGAPFLIGVPDDAKPARAVKLSRLDRTRAVLVELQGAHPGAVFRVDAPSAVIGRSSRAELSLSDTTVSSEHVRLTIEKGAVFAEDLSSRNGTFVNERRLVERTRLVDGDYLGVGGGSTIFKFSLMDEFEEGVLRTLFDLAQRDPLTGLHNRRYFDDRLLSEFLFAERHDASLGFLFIDIDHFKRVNDTHGHPMGDAVLKLVSRSIQKMMRPEDVLARYGGEEFTVLVRASSVRNLEILGARICHRIHALAFVLSSQGVGVTVSIGVSCMDTDRRFDSARALLAAADEALYEAKANGGNRVCVAGPA
ncbi:MAG TPA: GGDEF domain-containing protein [Polyangiaceae bacterium]|nr:GGDEF domain-containing protein [Polyangiaceae bacterium]